MILITTKSGKTGKMQVSYKTQYGISGVKKNYPLQTWFGQGAGGDTLTNSTFSWGRPLNVAGAPWYNSNINKDQTHDHMESISGLGSQENRALLLPEEPIKQHSIYRLERLMKNLTG